ncbi:MAG: AAA family ATPase [Verrucomicrobia bacterium]|jgi:hypothetical protein|nr:AAA family ATPase [Verrucomicrobiota bacterium]
MSDDSEENSSRAVGRLESEEQRQKKALWRLKRRFRSGEFSSLDVSILSQSKVDIYRLPDVESWRDLGNYEFVGGRWVFRRRPPYTAADVALSDIYEEGRIISVRREQERELIQKEVDRLNDTLYYILTGIRHLIEADEKHVNRRWKRRLGIDEEEDDVGEFEEDDEDVLELTEIDQREVHGKSIIGLNELFGRPKEQPKILIEQMLAKGWIGLLAGASKSYKSWMALQLALAVCQGREWLGFQTRKSRVLYVDYELSHASISGRVAKLCGHDISKENGDSAEEKRKKKDWDGGRLLKEYGPLHGPDFLMLGANFDSRNQIATILDAIRRTKHPEQAFKKGERTAQAYDFRTDKDGNRYKLRFPKVKVLDEDFGLYSDVYDLIIIDPLYMLLGGRDENSATEMADVFKEINLLRRATGAAVLINTHFRKGPRDWRTSSSDRISGSGVFSRYPDLIMTLSRVAEGMARAKQKELKNKFSLDITLRHLKGRDPVGLTLHDFVFELSRKGETDILLSTEPSRRGPKNKMEKEILKYLRDNYTELNGQPLSSIIKRMEKVKAKAVDGEDPKCKFKRSTLYKFFQQRSDHVSVIGDKRLVALAFAKRNEK